MKIDLQQLQHEDIRLSVNHEPGLFDLDSEDWRFEEPITGEVAFHLCDDDVLARGALHVQARGRCVRCLEPVPTELEVPINYVYQPRSQEPTDDVAHDHVVEAAPEIAYFDGLSIDPLEQLRESILLALPDLPHCPGCEAKRDEPAWRDEADGDGESEWKRKLRSLRRG